MACRYCIKRIGNIGQQSDTLYLCFKDSQIGIQNRLFEITDEASAAINFCTEQSTLGGELEERIITLSLEYREHENKIKKLNYNIKKFHNQRNQLVDLLLEQKINKGLYNQKYAKVSEEIEIAEGELQAHNENNEFGEDFRSRLLSFKRIFEKKKTMETFDSEIFRTLIKEAYIGETDEAGNPLPHTINFVFKTELKIDISPRFSKDPPEDEYAGGEDNKIAKALDDLSSVFMKLIGIVMLYAPIGLRAYFTSLIEKFGPQLLGAYSKAMAINYPVCIIYFFVAFYAYSYFSGGKEVPKIFF